MAHDAEEPPCIHHAFCHAKALAECFHADGGTYAEAACLPRERAYGVKSFQNGNLLLVSVGGWRATISACDFIYIEGGDNGGGSLTLLWHERLGPLCAATMAEYRPSEPLNMQYLRHGEETCCLTPHIAAAGRLSVCDRTARLSVEKAAGEIVRVAARGAWFSIEYEFTPDAVRICVDSQEDGAFFLPIIADRQTTVAFCGDDGGEIRIGGRLGVRADGAIRLPDGEAGRRYSQVGGFEYARLELPVVSGQPRVFSLFPAEEDG